MPAIIAKVYNILCFSFYFPTTWKENRTNLAPKANKDSSKVENWRPVIIGPILGRIFLSILDARIRMVIVQSLRQKGFTSENGCKINIELFNAVLNYSKGNNSGEGGGDSLLWISPKRLTRYSIPAMKPCLERKDVPTLIIDLIENMC